MASITGALLRIKQDLGVHLPDHEILNACRDSGHVWRERKLGPVLTVHLFVLQLLHCNTAIMGLRHLIRQPLNAAAYCRARMRLPLAVLEALLHRSAEAINQAHGEHKKGVTTHFEHLLQVLKMSSDPFICSYSNYSPNYSRPAPIIGDCPEQPSWWAKTPPTNCGGESTIPKADQ